jgi:hypothetical protein
VNLTGGKMQRRGGGFRPVTTETNGSYTSSLRWRFSVEERELRVGKGVVWDGGACRPFL